MGKRVRKSQIEDDCLHLLWCVANQKSQSGKGPARQSYAKLSKHTDIPQETVRLILGEYKEILKAVAYKYNYRVLLDCPDGNLIEVIYDGPVRSGSK